MKRNYLIVAVDFDETITYPATDPRVGHLNPHALQSMRRLHDYGCKIIIWTCRTGKSLDRCVALLDAWSIPYDAVNDNVIQSASRKVEADFYIENKSCISGVVEWDEITNYLLTKAAGMRKL